MVKARPLPHPHALQAQHGSEERATGVRKEVCKERVQTGVGGVPKGPKQQETPPRHRPPAQQIPLHKLSPMAVLRYGGHLLDPRLAF